MQFRKSLFILFTLYIFYSLNEPLYSQNSKNENIEGTELRNDKITILNFGSFHMGITTDANSTEFDERNKKNIDSVHQIAKMLADFKPTVIIVERTPYFNEELKENYHGYLKNPDTIFRNQSEIELLAFELGRLSGTKRIYGIDHKLEYKYYIEDEIINTNDSITYNNFVKNPFKYNPELNVELETLSLLDKLKLMNNQKFLDFLIVTNADILTHAGTAGNFEGADEAAKYYKRNLRMYSNLNQISLDKDDRVFILMGASHTAFFRDFMSRSPKYDMINTFNYLK